MIATYDRQNMFTVQATDVAFRDQGKKELTCGCFSRVPSKIVVASGEEKKILCH